MQITRQADYAVRAVVYMAQQGSESRVTTAQIAREQHIPPTVLAKILAQLSAAGLVRATRGSHGGVSMARSAGVISLLDVVEAIDGPILLNECVTDPSICPLGANCPVHAVWCRAQADLVDHLDRTKVAELGALPA